MKDQTIISPLMNCGFEDVIIINQSNETVPIDIDNWPPNLIASNQKLLIPLEDKYRIISINVEGYKKARMICDNLTKREFICGISSQKK